jgi:hypothetical protein
MRGDGMKFRVMIKDPDVLHDAIQEAVERDVEAMGLAGREAEVLVEMRAEKAQEACAKFWEYGEYLQVEHDTEAGTCVVVARY